MLHWACRGSSNLRNQLLSDSQYHQHGDGWYGGVYVGAMYTLAFVSDDIEYIVTEALKTIPQQSLYYLCINDVIQWYRQNHLARTATPLRYKRY